VTPGLQQLVLALISLFTLTSVALRTAIFLMHRDSDSLILWAGPFLGGILAWRIVRGGDWIEFNRERFLRIVLISGIILRLLALLDDLSDRPKQVSDWGKYELLGQRLAFDRRYYDFTTVNGIELRAFRPPGLPLLLAAGYSVMGEKAAPTVVMHLISLSSLLLAYAAARELRNPPSLLLMSYLSVSPHVLTLASITNTHVLALLIILAIVFVRQAVKNRSVQCLITGGIIGAGTLVRAELLLLFVAAVIALIAMNTRSLRYSLQHSAILGLAALAVVLPWSARNWMVLGKFVLISTNSGAVLYSANVTSDFRRGGGYNGIGADFYRQNSPTDEVELDALLRRAALQHMIRNFKIYLLSVPFRVGQLMGMQQWAIGYSREHSRRPLPGLFYYICMALEQILSWGLYLAAGLWLASRVLRGESSFFLLSYALIIPGFAFLFESLDRNHFPYLLMPILAAATGWSEEGRRNRRAAETCPTPASGTCGSMK